MDILTQVGKPPLQYQKTGLILGAWLTGKSMFLNKKLHLNSILPTEFGK